MVLKREATTFNADLVGPYEYYGNDVALSGDGSTLAVAQGYASLVYIYLRRGSEWVPQAQLRTSGVSYLQTTVALSEDGSVLVTGGYTGDQRAHVWEFRRVRSSWRLAGEITITGSTPDGTTGCPIALSADGRTLAVGAPSDNSNSVGVNSTRNELAVDSGAVYVFASVGTDSLWEQRAYLKASNTDANDFFGSAVAMSADATTIAVSAPLEDSGRGGVNPVSDNEATDSGAVYVFRQTAGVWSQQAILKADQPGTNAKFGIGVALAGDGSQLAVGAPDEPSGSVGVDPARTEGSGSGAVYTFAQSGSWRQTAYIRPPVVFSRFGASVALSSAADVLIVGDVLENSDATGVGGVQNPGQLAGAGAAYVLIRTGTTWRYETFVKASRRSEYFGEHVATNAAGTLLAIGTTKDSDGGGGINGGAGQFNANSGAVYVY